MTERDQVALPRIDSLEVAAGQSNAMVDDLGQIFYPDGPEDAAMFAEEHGARWLHGPPPGFTEEASAPAPVEVVELSAEEWQASAERGLDRVGLTYEQLSAQATRRRFSSIEALKLWYAIGGNYSPKPDPQGERS